MQPHAELKYMQPYAECLILCGDCYRSFAFINWWFDFSFCKGTFPHIIFCWKFWFVCFYHFPTCFSNALLHHLPSYVFISIHPNFITCILDNNKIWKMDLHCIWSFGVQLRARILLGLLKEIHMPMVSQTRSCYAVCIIYPEPPSIWICLHDISLPYSA
jgi:hypothetical protein